METKYNEEAFEKALSKYNSPDISTSEKELLEFIFPELCELEDENIRKEIIEFIKEGKGYCCPSSEKRQKWAYWLEKQKETKLTGEEIDDIFKQGQDSVVDNPEKFCLQKKCKWSEEDEKCRNALINICSYPHDEMDGRPWGKWINWLKSLNPKQQWKPSDLELQALEQAMNTVNVGSHFLHTLYDKLKTLSD